MIRCATIFVALASAGCSTTAPRPAPEQAAAAPEPPAPEADGAARGVDAAPPETTLEPPEQPEAVPEPEPEPTPLPEDVLAFTDPCAPTEVVTIAAVGDIMGHREIQRQAYATDEGFRAVWANIADLLAGADITYGNLEAPTAPGLGRDHEAHADPGRRFDNQVYSGYARFNIHPSILDDLVQAGFDVVSTANNHSLDRDAEGIDRTLAQLRKRKLAHTGTRPAGTEKPFWAITEAKGMRIAWVSCTLHTNFGKDDLGQVLHCFEPGDPVRKQVRRLKKRKDVDAVIVTPHWGKEYTHEPRERQRKFAQRWLDAGATAIIGSHPHVVEPWEIRDTADGRQGFVFYSLGNFFSHQRTLNRRSTVILYLGLAKTDEGVRVVGARYVPLHVRMEGDKKAFFVEAIDRVHGPQDARKLLVDLLGPSSILPPELPVNVRPQCGSARAPSP
ncbi:MAG: CapA family protein [Nannocystales bacterium]